MKLISHRGNIDGPIPEIENNPLYIKKAIELGYDVEIDIRLHNDELFLGHDTPDYRVDIPWLFMLSDKLWIHTKNFEALNLLIDIHDLKVFYHQLESHTIINNSKIIWSHNLIEASIKSIIPLLSDNDIDKWVKKDVYGVCSDYVNKLKGNI